MSKYYDRVDEATYLFANEDTDTNGGDRRQTKRHPPILTLAEKAYKSRWVSVRIIYMLTFMDYISYTATLASLWAYLKVLDPDARTTTMGWVVSAYAMGQIVSGPFFGFWSNRRSVKEALVVSLLLELLAYVFYMYLASLPDHRGYYMVAARWLIGFGSGSIPLSRTYVANATSLSERTSAIANTNIYGALGFILGPLVQTAVVPISYPGLIESKAFHFNMYTAPILLAGLVTFISLTVVLFVFTEHTVEEDEMATTDGDAEKGTPPTDQTKTDYVTAVSCVILFFCSLFNVAFMETIIVPLIMYNYAWTKSRATLLLSVGIGSTALLSILIYVIIKWMSKRVKERVIFLLGFVIIVLSYLVVLPWGRHYPRVSIAVLVKSAPLFHTTVTPPGTFVNNNNNNNNNYYYYNSDSNDSITTQAPSLVSTQTISTPDDYPPIMAAALPEVNTSSSTHGFPFQLSHSFPRRLLLPPYATPTWFSLFTNPWLLPSANGTIAPPVGCPWQYSWCQTVPAISQFQMLVCLVLFGIGYPTTNVLTIAIFSKTLGPKQMGLWMGILIASGCLAGIVSPVMQTTLYERFGARVTFVSVAVLMSATCLFILGIFRRLGPPKQGRGMDINKG